MKLFVMVIFIMLGSTAPTWATSDITEILDVDGKPPFDINSSGVICEGSNYNWMLYEPVSSTKTKAKVKVKYSATKNRSPLRFTIRKKVNGKYDIDGDEFLLAGDDETIRLEYTDTKNMIYIAFDKATRYALYSKVYIGGGEMKATSFVAHCH